MYEIRVWLGLASATSEFHKIQIFYHNILQFSIYHLQLLFWFPAFAGMTISSYGLGCLALCRKV